MDSKNSFNYKIIILGMGPGHRDYQLPITTNIINNAHLVVGSRRCLDQIEHPNQRVYGCGNSGRWEDIKEEIKAIYQNQQVVILVAGDPGFYSLLDQCLAYFGRDALLVYPGISSFQYLFAKMKRSYKQMSLLSLHGRESRWLEVLKQPECEGVFLLTDQQHDPNWIVEQLKCRGHNAGSIIVGENLSYEDECITACEIEQWQNKVYKKLSVVVIINDMAV